MKLEKKRKTQPKLLTEALIFTRDSDAELKSCSNLISERNSPSENTASLKFQRCFINGHIIKLFSLVVYTSGSQPWSCTVWCFSCSQHSLLN